MRDPGETPKRPRGDSSYEPFRASDGIVFEKVDAGDLPSADGAVAGRRLWRLMEITEGE